MAIFRFEAKLFGRQSKGKSGKRMPGRRVSMAAKAAYRAGQKLTDWQTGEVYNYRSRAQEVLHCEIVAPADAPGWLLPVMDERSDAARREALWNAIEQREKRVDSQLAREFVIALPRELTHEQHVALMRHWCQDQVASKGFVADFAIHASTDGKNPHSHVLCTLRPVESDGFGNKPDMSGKFNGRGSVGAGAKSELQSWRKAWEMQCNAALEAAGLDVRIDHLSLADQGIDREPEPKIGPEATGMQRRGTEEDPQRVREARWVRMSNGLRSFMQFARSPGEADAPEGESWWINRSRDLFTHAAQEFGALMRDESSGGRELGKDERADSGENAPTIAAGAGAEEAAPADPLGRRFGSEPELG